MNSKPQMTIGTSATDWAIENGTAYAFRARVNGYPETDRRAETAVGMLYTYQDGRGSKAGRPAERAILADRRAFPDATGAMFVVDFGDHLRAYYVAGWHRDQDHLILADIAGSPVGWQLEPRRAYHLTAFAQEV